MKKNILVLKMVLLFMISCGDGTTKEQDQEAIRTVIKTCETYWNDGDLKKYMDVYWKSDEVRLISKSGIIYGSDNIYEHYRKKYVAKESMGKISFKLLDIRQLATSLYSVTGKYYLSNGSQVRDGIYTLVFKKIDGKWLVVSDHTN